jgi:orsellinic acid C2-O-methyltransferase
MTDASSRPPASPAGARSGPLPPRLVLYQLAVGHYVSRALALAAKLGLADRLGDAARTADDLAAETGTHAPSLRRVLRLLVSVGALVEEADGAFRLTPMGSLLREDAPGSMKDAVSVFAGEAIQDGWKQLEFCVRTGQPAFKKRDPDADAFDAMRADPEAEARFDRAMAAFTSQTAVAVASAYDFGGLGSLMDVGGGNGALLIGILRAVPSLRGIVFDQPNVVERARKQASAAGLSPRLDVVGGSFFDAIPAGADAYMLKHVIHDWNDADATAILRNCRSAMTDRGRLLIVEGIYPPRIDGSLESRGAAANDVNMLVSTGGRQRSEEEFRALYRASGFELSRIVPTPAPVSVIEGVPR